MKLLGFPCTAFRRTGARRVVPEAFLGGLTDLSTGQQTGQLSTDRYVVD